MKALLIGGTGTISMAITRLLVEKKWDHISSEFLTACSDYDFEGSLIGDKANSVIFDNTKLKRAVPGFIPQVRFEEGIRDIIQNVLTHPEYQKEDPEFDAWCDKIIRVLEEAKTKM